MAHNDNRLKIFTSQAISALTPVLATLAALGVFAVILMTLGANPVEAYGALIEGAVGSGNAVADTLVKATPLLLIGLGTCIAFRGGVTNIGGEGQLIVGPWLRAYPIGDAGWIFCRRGVGCHPRRAQSLFQCQ